MVVQQASLAEIAESFARTASEALLDQAEYLRSLPAYAWSSPTGCDRWTLRDLVGHVAAEATWFPSLVRGVTDDAPPMPDTFWTAIRQLPAGSMADRISEAANELVTAVEGANAGQLEHPVDVGVKIPLWQALWICMLEAVIHNWDSKAKRELGATIPIPWARALAQPSVDFAPYFAHWNVLRKVPGQYLLEVGDGIGSITIVVQNGDICVCGGVPQHPDVTVYLTADQYMRLLLGRFPLIPALESGEVAIEGDRDLAANLNRIFAGIGG